MFHLISINCRYSHSCLAQFYVRNALEKHLPGHPVVLTQLTINDPYYDTLLRISEKPARAILFSVYIWNHQFVRRLITDLARLLPELPIIIGGPQAAALADLPAQCSLLSGEIEGVGEQFYRDLDAGTLQPLYRADPCRSFPSPYRAEDFSGPLKNRQLYYESSRGCPFFCSYCLSSISRGVRHKPLDTVKQELLQLIRARPMIIKFVDRTFNDNSDRALNIWQFLVEHAAGVKCHFEIAPDLFTDEMLEFLAAVPCDLFQFEIGIQSCNTQTLGAVNRQMDVERAGKNIQRLAALNTIHLHVDLILGLPFETGESFRQSFNRVFMFAPHYIQLGLLKILPGTEMAERAAEFGMISCSEPPYEVLATRWLEHTELRDLHAFCEVVESFYNNRFFRSLWQYLLQRAEEPFSFFQQLLALCRSHGFFQLARTHKLMNRILFELVRKRQDHILLLDLLRYDWLRCGHRTLPDYLTVASQGEIRAVLRLELPQNMEGVFDYRSRVEFLKQSSFLKLSSEVVDILALGKSGSCIAAFQPQQAGGVMKYNKTTLLQDIHLDFKELCL
jgi:radical SAM superfamily enzyme